MKVIIGAILDADARFDNFDHLCRVLEKAKV